MPEFPLNFVVPLPQIHEYGVVTPAVVLPVIVVFVTGRSQHLGAVLRADRRRHACRRRSSSRAPMVRSSSTRIALVIPSMRLYSTVLSDAGSRNASKRAPGLLLSGTSVQSKKYWFSAARAPTHTPFGPLRDDVVADDVAGRAVVADPVAGLRRVLAAVLVEVDATGRVGRDEVVADDVVPRPVDGDAFTTGADVRDRAVPPRLMYAGPGITSWYPLSSMRLPTMTLYLLPASRYRPTAPFDSTVLRENVTSVTNPSMNTPEFSEWWKLLFSMRTLS